ncbi:MAG: prepilin-type N-terminal cleavage/methylation domain-containing protein [Planctomycetes bacterium]|nr:prepilin-type N-terminal cleavage/methylation domain-containing protein [Planctomycetota bacterium]
MRNSSTSRSGMTLIEIVVVVAIIGILGATITPLVLKSLHTDRKSGTVAELREIKDGIIGNPEVVTKEIRTHFGFVGDMGSMPTKIEDLYQKGTQPAYSYNSTKKTGAGWRGPYIDPSLAENLASLKLDAYGYAYTYSAAEFADATTGATVSAKITSKGADATSGGGDDLSAYIYKSDAFSTVVGTIVDGEGHKVPNVTVKMNYPSNGTLTESTTTTDSSGSYQFTNIPYGNRSITIEPGLGYTTATAEVFGAGNQNVEFRVTNLSASAIAITSFKADYTVTPTAYYGKLFIAGTKVYDSTNPRLGSGDTATFAAENVPGSGAATTGRSFPVRVQSPLTQVEDIDIVSVTNKGTTIVISMEVFKDAQTGGGSNVDMAGVTFEVTFSDGSTALFSPTE